MSDEIEELDDDMPRYPHLSISVLKNDEYVFSPACRQMRDANIPGKQIKEMEDEVNEAVFRAKVEVISKWININVRD